MHGIGGDHKEWQIHGSPQNILDNLYAEGKLADMFRKNPKNTPLTIYHRQWGIFFQLYTLFC